MKTKAFPYKDVQHYLDATGIFDTGTAQEIETARKVFRKLYLQQYQKERYANTHTNVTISLSKQEKALLEKHALKNGKKLASYIKTIALDIAKPNTENSTNITTDLTEIKRLLSLSHDVVEALHFENEYSELQQSYDELLQLFEQLEALLK